MISCGFRSVTGQTYIIYFHIVHNDISYTADVWLLFHQSEQRNGILDEGTMKIFLINKSVGVCKLASVWSWIYIALKSIYFFSQSELNIFHFLVVSYLNPFSPLWLLILFPFLSFSHFLFYLNFALFCYLLVRFTLIEGDRKITA